MPNREFKRRFVVAALQLYAVGYLCALPLLQVRLARAEGLASWALLGFVVPFFEALVWPLQLAVWLGLG